MTSQAYQGNDASAMYYKKVDMDCQLSVPESRSEKPEGQTKLNLLDLVR